MPHNTCPEPEDLATYVEAGELLAPADEIHAHLLACSRCRELVEDIRESNRLAQQMKTVCKEVLDQSGLMNQFNLTSHTPVSNTIVLPHFHENYDVREEIGRGGMGVVYRAIQKATKREVALKVMLEGPFASKSTKQRFEREVELAAQLDHPGIVTILESGVDSGRYYFAMQYIHGMRLDRWVSVKEPDLQDKLRTFIKIGEAITHAHQRGVIHRDLKPSNLLIDEKGNPHILDFGLAKLTETEGQQVPQPSLLSVTGQIIGTLPYLSPEQACNERYPADVRTDVYALGVLLYQMLTDQYPYNVTGQIVDVLRSIQESQPSRPSRCTDKLDEDIDTITLKTLSKEPDRRYQSVADLTRDIEHYLNGEPLDARRNSRWYILRKTYQQYQVSVIALTSVFITSIILAIVFANLYRRAKIAQKEAEDSRDIAEMSLKLTPVENASIDEHFSNLSTILNFLNDNPDNGDTAALVQRTQQEEQQLIDKINREISGNHIDTIIALFFKNPINQSILEYLQDKYPDTKIKHQVVSHIESTLHFPFIKKRGHTFVNATELLKDLRRTNSLSDITAVGLWEEWKSSRSFIYPDSHNDKEANHISGWVTRWGQEPKLSDAPVKKLILSGEPQSSSEIFWKLPPDALMDGNAVVGISLDVSILSISPKEEHHHIAAIGFEDNNQRIASIGIDKCNIHSSGIHQGDAVLTSQKTKEGAQYHIDLYYSCQTDSLDVMMNGAFIGEDIQGNNAPDPNSVYIVANLDCTIAVDNIAISVSQKPLKANAAVHPPAIHINELPLSLVQSFDYHLIQGLEITDFDNDGQAEIFTLESRKKHLANVSTQSTYLTCQRYTDNNQLTTIYSQYVGDLVKPSLHMLNNKLYIWHEGKSNNIPGSPLSSSQVAGVTLYEQGPDGIARATFSHDCNSSAFGILSEFKINESQKGLALACNHHSFCFKTFRPIDNAEEINYKQDYPIRDTDDNIQINDFLSLSPYDWDADGDDDLIVGSGLWQGERPSCIIMENGHPEQLIELHYKSGPTKVLIWEQDNTSDLLVASSTPSDSTTDTHKEETGLRLWPLTELIKNTTLPPIYFEPTLGLQFDSGHIGGVSILAVVSGPNTVTNRKNSYVSLYAFIDGQIRKIWKMGIRSGERYIYDVFINDIDGISGNELIIILRNPDGVLIFKPVIKPTFKRDSRT